MVFNLCKRVLIDEKADRNFWLETVTDAHSTDARGEFVGEFIIHAGLHVKSSPRRRENRRGANDGLPARGPSQVGASGTREGRPRDPDALQARLFLTPMQSLGLSLGGCTPLTQGVSGRLPKIAAFRPISGLACSSPPEDRATLRAVGGRNRCFSTISLSVAARQGASWRTGCRPMAVRCCSLRLGLTFARTKFLMIFSTGTPRGPTTINAISGRRSLQPLCEIATDVCFMSKLE